MIRKLYISLHGSSDQLFCPVSVQSSTCVLVCWHYSVSMSFVCQGSKFNWLYKPESQCKPFFGTNWHPPVGVLLLQFVSASHALSQKTPLSCENIWRIHHCVCHWSALNWIWGDDTLHSSVYFDWSVKSKLYGIFSPASLHFFCLFESANMQPQAVSFQSDHMY